MEMDSTEKNMDDWTEKKMDDWTEKKMNSKKHRIPDRYVRLILALPAKEPIDPARQNAALAQRTYDRFARF
jgi:hypothetical protein